MRRLSILLLCCLACYTQAQGEPPFTATATNYKDGATLVDIPAGSFQMGTNRKDKDDPDGIYFNAHPQHSVMLKEYWIYRAKVTKAQYKLFCSDTQRVMPSLPDNWQDNFPIVNITWYDAQAYASWAGMRLPTEAEWEKAASGTQGRLFPWSMDDWRHGQCCVYGVNDKHQEKIQPVDSKPEGMSLYGLYNMVGNASEWCQDLYEEDYYKKQPKNDPLGPQDQQTYTNRVIRGGSYKEDTGYSCPYRSLAKSDFHCRAIGFRCASDTPPPQPPQPHYYNVHISCPTVGSQLIIDGNIIDGLKISDTCELWTSPIQAGQHTFQLRHDGYKDSPEKIVSIEVKDQIIVFEQLIPNIGLPATLNVTINPPEALLLLDGTPQHRQSPFNLTIDEPFKKEYALRAELDGYLPHEEKLQALKSGDIVQMNIQLHRFPQLVLTTRPPGATAYITVDGTQYAQSTPLNMAVPMKDERPKEVHIEMQLNGYRPASRDVTLTCDHTVTVDIPLEIIPDMIQIPAGDYFIGKGSQTENAFIAEGSNRKKVHIDAFQIEPHMVSIADYRRYCDEKGIGMPPQPQNFSADSPVVNVTWEEADAYARSRGMLLPSEAEWEVAALRSDAFIIPKTIGEWCGDQDVEKPQNHRVRGYWGNEKDKLVSRNDFIYNYNSGKPNTKISFVGFRCVKH